MLQLVESWFVGRPANILLVAGLFALAWLLGRTLGLPNPRALLWGGLPWVLWAAWEWAVVVRSPDANIRVDLLVILPVVVLVGVASIVFALRSRPG